jgi:hypothetical protein
LKFLAKQLPGRSIPDLSSPSTTIRGFVKAAEANDTSTMDSCLAPRAYDHFKAARSSLKKYGATKLAHPYEDLRYLFSIATIKELPDQMDNSENNEINLKWSVQLEDFWEPGPLTINPGTIITFHTHMKKLDGRWLIISF